MSQLQFTFHNSSSRLWRMCGHPKCNTSWLETNLGHRNLSGTQLVTNRLPLNKKDKSVQLKYATKIWTTLTGTKCQGNTFSNTSKYTKLQRPLLLTTGQPCTDYCLGGDQEGANGQTSWIFVDQLKIILNTLPLTFRLEKLDNAHQVNHGTKVQTILDQASLAYSSKTQSTGVPTLESLLTNQINVLSNRKDVHPDQLKLTPEQMQLYFSPTLNIIWEIAKTLLFLSKSLTRTHACKVQRTAPSGFWL